MKHLLPAALLALVAGCSPAGDAAPTKPDAHTANGMAMDMDGAAPAPGDSPATRGYKAAMTDMMANAPAYTGDADIDFMKQMRPHHQAAIDMAQAELASGKDAEARALAQEIIAAQQAEIAQIDAWLAKKGQSPKP